MKADVEGRSPLRQCGALTPLPEGEASVHLFVYVHITTLLYIYVEKTEKAYTKALLTIKQNKKGCRKRRQPLI